MHALADKTILTNFPAFVKQVVEWLFSPKFVQTQNGLVGAKITWAWSMGSGDALQATRQRVRFPPGPPI